MEKTIPTTLIEIISSTNFLLDAWKKLRKTNRLSKGLSGITINSFEKDLENNISQICKDLKSGNYRFQPTRAVVIKKDNGKYRPLQIPEIRDRVVLKAISILLENELEEYLNSSKGISFAYQKGIGVKNAVLKMKELYVKGETFILKSDIINFFETVDKEYLLKEKVFPYLKDNTITNLIQSALSQPLKGKKRLLKKHKELFKNVGKGIPQGNPLSPLLSNIYLREFDIYMCDNGFRLIRYADDFIVLCQNEEEAKKAHDVAASFLLKLKLKVHPINEANNKSVILNPEFTDFSFLSIGFDGDKIFLSAKKVKSLKSKIREAIHIHNDIKEAIIEVEKIVKRWISLYEYTDIERHFKIIDSYINCHLKKRFDKNWTYQFTSCEKQLENIKRKNISTNPK